MTDTAATAVNWNTIILAIIGLASTIVTSVVAVYMAKIKTGQDRTLVNSDKTLTNSEETKSAARDTAVSVERVHVAVNSERTAMLAEVKALRDEILALSKAKATLEERERGPKAPGSPGAP